MKKLRYLVLLLLPLLPCSSDAQIIEGMENALQSVGEAVNTNSDGDLFLLELFFEIGYYPTWGLLFGFENEPLPNEVMFSDFPYSDGRNGLYQPLNYDGRLVRTSVTAHFQNNEDALYGGFLQVKFSPNRFLTLDVNRLQLFEELENGGTDHFSITNFNLQYNRIRHQRFHLWWGGGLMLLDGELMYGSPSISTGFTWYFKRPLSLYADTQIGWPNGVIARQHQLRMQAHAGRFMVYAGYQGLRAGNVRVPNWTMGTGVWF